MTSVSFGLRSGMDASCAPGPLQTAPAANIFLRRWFLYAPIEPSHCLIDLFSQTRICLAILSNSLEAVLASYHKCA